MPFSAVVIGVGDGEFDKMDILDADGEVLKDSDGNEAIRDIVQLVQYDDFKDLGQRELALEVLGELPDQFVDYMVMKENEPHKIYRMQEPTPEEDNASRDAASPWVSNRLVLNSHGSEMQPLPSVMEEFKMQMIPGGDLKVNNIMLDNQSPRVD